MINLIPNQEKKKKVKDFYFRLFVVFLAMLASCALVAVVVILPTYFLSAIEKNIAKNKLGELKNTPETPASENLAGTVAGINTKLQILEEAKRDKYLVSKTIIQEISARKMSDIRITKISYENEPQNGKKVLVQGVAPSRERLLLFRQSLEEGTAFKQVDLPISNFVKGSNIEFSLNLIPS